MVYNVFKGNRIIFIISFIILRILKDRRPLPVNYNPLLLMKHDTRAEYNDQAVKTANVIISSLRFMKSLADEILVPEIFHINTRKTDTPEFRSKIMKYFPSFIATYAAYFYKAYPLDMSQYQGLFAATRIPKRDKDEIERFQNIKHVVIMMDGHFYTVEVLDRNGNLREPEFIYSQVKYLMTLRECTKENESPMGALTTQNRRTWAAARAHLLTSSLNSKNLKLIDSALFCISLDDTTYDDTSPVQTVRNFLFDECRNRWYDKSLSVIIDKSGTTGINFEHSWGDGIAILRYFNEIYKDMRNPYVGLNTNVIKGVESTVQKLQFEFDQKAKSDIDKALREHKRVIDSLDMNFLRYQELNKASCKKYKVSPDSIMQLSFQLGYYKQKRKFVGTYESCSTAAFRHGRTETMRPCTSETKALCEAIESKNRPSNKELRAMIDRCSEKHNRLTKEAAMGQGNNFFYHILLDI